MSKFIWWFDFVPWWGWALLVLILLGFCWQYLVPLWAVVPPPLRKALAVIGALALAWLAGRNRGVKDAKAVQDKNDAEAVSKRQEIDREIDNLPDADLDKRYDRWVRPE